jgi:shikimate kinase
VRRVFITGVSCVGKTTIGTRLAELLGVKFFDLDTEIEAFFGISIERLQQKYNTIWGYREEAAKALVNLLHSPDSRDSVIALPPSGLMGWYLRAVKKSAGTIIALMDTPENILERITFYDIDSKLIAKCLTGEEKNLYRREINKDITYYGKTYKRAHLQINISGLTIDQSAVKVQDALKEFRKKC